MAGTIHSTIGTDRTDMAGIMVGTTHTIGVGEVDIHITITTITTITTTIAHIVHRTTGLHTTTHHTRARVAWATRDTTTTTALVRS